MALVISRDAPKDGAAFIEQDLARNDKAPLPAPLDQYSDKYVIAPVPIRMYALPLDQIQKGDWLHTVKSGPWLYFLVPQHGNRPLIDANPVAGVELFDLSSAEDRHVGSISTGPVFEELANCLSEAAKRFDSEEEEVEPRLLSVPALGFRALWCHKSVGTDDWFTPLSGLSSRSKENWLSANDFLKHLKMIANSADPTADATKPSSYSITAHAIAAQESTRQSSNAPSELMEYDPKRAPGAGREGIGLALSGGGYRAMLFHVGAILRLNEARLLGKLKRISSVSGGSITAGVCGLCWKKLEFRNGVAVNLDEQFVRPIRAIASETIDGWSIGFGILTPGMTIGDFVARSYRKILFGDATLQDLPDDAEGPRFVFNATSVQTGALVRFSKPYAADYLVGQIIKPEFPLAQVIAASTAFPPVLSPITIDVDPDSFDQATRGPLFQPPYNDTWVLSDGGVYDNLGLETIDDFQTILVSDGGATIAPEASPASNWAEHSKRVLEIIDKQVRSLRKRHLIESFRNKTRSGTYWGVRTNIADYRNPRVLRAPHETTMELAETPTRLKALSDKTQNHLMNWGYAVCDAALRTHVAALLPADFDVAPGFPFDNEIG